MNKTEFVEKYAEKTGMNKKDAAAAVNAFTKEILNLIAG